MYRISFITNDATIRSHLLALGHTDSQNTREALLGGFIPDNFCRDESGLTKSLRDFVTKQIPL